MPFDHASRHLREIESATAPKLIIWVGERRNRSASRDTIWSTLAPSPCLLMAPSDTEVAISRPVSRPLASSPSGPTSSPSGLAKIVAATPIMSMPMAMLENALAVRPASTVHTTTIASTASAVAASPNRSIALSTPRPIVWNGTVNRLIHSKLRTNLISHSAVAVTHR